MTTLRITTSISRSPLRRGLPVIALMLACFALSPAPKAFGVTPAPDGGYPGQSTAEGDNALFSYICSGLSNCDDTAIGFDALYSDTNGKRNTATGSGALYSTTADDNTANGYEALYNNTTGVQNTANGSGALDTNTTGSNNTALGYEALDSSTTGYANVANGSQALYANTTGEDNTANGFEALYYNTTGFENTANGVYALYQNTTSHDNTADGYEALLNNTTGSNNIALGVSAGSLLTTGNYNIDIGAFVSGGAGEAGTIRIGNSNQSATYIAGIYGVNEGGIPLAVYINSNGQLGTLSSSRRFKKEIKPMDQTSQAILGLQPVTFQYKSDSSGTAQFGLIAEEVAKVDPDLVVRDATGEIYSVRYEAVNAMLLNEFLKEHRKVQEQEASIVQLKSTAAKQEATIAQQQKDFQATAAQQQEEIKTLSANLKKQASQIQKVSDQLELSKSAPQMAGNDR
jgi:Chaperone of endosialidase